MIECIELGKSFATKEDMFKELIISKELIIKEKTSQVYKSCLKGISIITNQSKIIKSLSANKEVKIDEDYYYFVVNSSNILDSHGDVHVKGNWDKTVKEQQGKVFLVFDHTLKRSEIIAMKEDIEMFTAEVSFSLLGKEYDGNSYCLIYKVRKDKIINKEAKEWLESGYSFEASVRMQYVKIDLAINSDNNDFKKEKELFDKYYPLIANKSDYPDVYYFWIIREAKNIYESSLVLFASNSATGLIQENKTEADNITTEQKEPSNDTQQTNKKKVKFI